MAIDFSFYQKVCNITAKEKEGEVISEMQDNMNYALEHNMVDEYHTKIGIPYYTRTATVNSTFPDERELKLVCVFSKNKDAILEAMTRRILFENGQLKQGDYIDLPENWESVLVGGEKKLKYIVYSQPKIDHKYSEVIVMECQHTFSLLDNDGKVRTYGYYGWDNKSRMRLSINDSANVDNSNFEAFVKKDEYTARLGYEITRIMIRDDVAKRDYFYEVAQDNILDHKGLICLLFKNSSYVQSEDNLELGIADYNKQLALTQPKPPTGVLRGQDELFPTEVGDYELVGVIGQIIEWSINSPNAQLTVIDNTHCQVKCLKANNDHVTLTAKVNNVAITKEILLKRW